MTFSTMFEEVFFRGFLQTRFANAFGVVPALLLSGVAFSLYHVGYGAEYRNADAIVEMALVGLLFAVGFQLTRNVLTSFVLNLPHAIVTFVGIEMLPYAEERRFFTPWAAMLALVVVVLGLAWIELRWSVSAASRYVRTGLSPAFGLSVRVCRAPAAPNDSRNPIMDFAPSPRVEKLRTELLEFMDRYITPNERVAVEQVHASGDEHATPPIVKELKKKAKAAGLWNLFMPDERYGPGLKNWEYGMLCEIMGRSYIASTVFNCAAPDTGNMEILAEFGTEEQKKRWLQPLLDGEIRSCFSMTEPEVSGADPTLLRTRAVRDGDHYVINGHKWFTSGAIGASVAIVMVVTDPEAAPHMRASQILVPTDTPGFKLVRPVSVMGHAGGGGHCEVLYEDCRVPASNLLGPGGTGFMIAQARLGPGRIHHCMRAIGGAERRSR